MQRENNFGEVLRVIGSNYFREPRVLSVLPTAHETDADVATTLAGKVRSLKVIELPGSGKDLTDWTEAGGRRAALLGFVETQPEWKPAENWRKAFHTFADFEQAPSLSFAIRDFLQVEAATVIGGLSGHGKTWLMLSIAKALLRGKRSRLWCHFDVLETANRILYLIPESSVGPFSHRLKLLGMWEYLRDDRLLVRTLSLGPKPRLDDVNILAAADRAFVFLGTLARFTEGPERSSTELQAL